MPKLEVRLATEAVFFLRLVLLSFIGLLVCVFVRLCVFALILVILCAEFACLLIAMKIMCVCAYSIIISRIVCMCYQCAHNDSCVCTLRTFFICARAHFNVCFLSYY